MSINHSNQEIVREVYESALNKRNRELLRDLISPDFTGIRGLKGAAGFEEPTAGLIKSFPDIQWTIKELMGEGNKVAVRWTLEGTFTGAPFTSYAPTGKKITNEGMAIFELKEGKIISAQILTDRLGFLQQLEVLPVDLTTRPIRKPHPDAVRFIDKFIIPAAAKKEFYDRMNSNRAFIRKLPGFIEDEAYEYTDKDGNVICLTIATWENKEALQKAKALVQDEYKREGFDPGEMMSRLHIAMDRGIYSEVSPRGAL
jgi:predicted ester cyclase